MFKIKVKVLYLITLISLLILPSVSIDHGYNYPTLNTLNTLTAIGTEAGLTCNECKKIFDVIKVFDKTETGHHIIQDLAKTICIKKNGFGNCKQFCDDLCEGIISEYAPVVWSLSKLTDGEHFCTFLQFCQDNTTDLTLTPEKPLTNFTFSKQSFMNMMTSYSKAFTEYFTIKDNNEKYFLHLTDLHVDYQYHINTSVNCGLPQCCRLNYNKTLDGQPNIMSQTFGNIGCDTPNATWTSLLNEVKSVHKEVNFSFVLITGDIPPHDVWNQSHLGNLETIRNVLSDLEETFPETPIYYIFGNHDNYPINLCTTNSSVQTSYNALDYFRNISTLGWFKWLSDEAKESFLMTGQYRTIVNGTDLLLVALNSNLFTSGNIWLSLENNYQIGNVSFFLEDSFNKYPNNSIYIINHIPFYANEFLPNVIDAYNLIANQNRIKGIFEGHQHSDNFHLMYDYNGLPSQISYIPPALVAGQANPSFRYYSANPDSWDLMDYYQYRMNLTKSNEDNEIEWFLAYQAKEMFTLKDLSATSWYDFVRTLDDDETYEKYLIDVFHGGLNIPENKKEIVCSLLTNRVDLTRWCIHNSSFFQ
jgi:sphingomyelin phosphodiesterase